MRKFLIRHAPPGIPLRQEIYCFLIGHLCAFLLSLGFLANYLEARRMLFDHVNGKRLLIEGAVITDFPQLLRFTALGYFAVVCFMLGLILNHYIYYRQGSMSIYLMKRLPRPGERHLRALTLPLLAILLTVLVALILRFLYFTIYLLATPVECLPEQVWKQLWRLF